MSVSEVVEMLRHVVSSKGGVGRVERKWIVMRSEDLIWRDDDKRMRK